MLAIHSASAGEFEQARPIIRELRRRNGKIWIVATFSSASGLHQHANAHEVDAIVPLPLDTVCEVNAFLDRCRPSLVVVVRYDFWPVLSDRIRRRGIPSVLVCGTLRESSMRTCALLRFFFALPYRNLTYAMTVGDADRRQILRLSPGTPCVVVGDTRYDRAVERATQQVDLPLPRTPDGRVVLIAGSTWSKDERLLADLGRNKRLRLVIVPHEPSEHHLRQTESVFKNARRLSHCSGAWPDDHVIVDCVGLLSALYRLGDIAWVGGAFGAGVHSVLEPAAYGLPVLCGPRIERSPDAQAMYDSGLLTVVNSASDLRTQIASIVDDDTKRATIGQKCRQFVEHRTGATDAIVDGIDRMGLLPIRTAGDNQSA